MTKKSTTSTDIIMFYKTTTTTSTNVTDAVKGEMSQLKVWGIR